MKDLFAKAKLCIGSVLSVIMINLLKLEDCVWRIEDRIPWLKNTYRALCNFFKNISVFIDFLAEKVGYIICDNPLTKKIKAYDANHEKKHSTNDKVLSTKFFATLKRQQVLISAVVIELILVLWGILMEVDLLFLAVVLTWSMIVIFSIAKMEQRAMILMFCLTFFVFLMGRDFLQQFFRYKPEDFPEEVQTHTYICLFIALVGLFLSYWLIKRKTTENVYNRESKDLFVLKTAKCMLLIVLVPAVLYRLILTFYVQKYGYNAYYTDFALLLDKNIFLYILSKVEQMASACFCIYIAAMPEKKEFYKITSAYVIYLALTLGAGARSPFLLGVFLIIFYFLYRAGLSPEESWFKRKYIAPCVAIMAAIAIVMYLAGVYRDGIYSSGGSTEGLFGFIYSQGVSVNVIKRGYMLQDQIPDGYLYSMDFTRYGLIARIFGITVYSGNTVEQALYGGSFAHALSYVFLGDTYLAGRGTGTSYIAELYHDFWYIGVFVGSVVYGWLCTRIETFKENKVFIRSCLFIIITQLLWAPRGGFTKIITTLISPSSLIALICVFGISWLLKRRKKWRLENVEKVHNG